MTSNAAKQIHSNQIKTKLGKKIVVVQAKLIREHVIRENNVFLCLSHFLPNHSTDFNDVNMSDWFQLHKEKRCK